MVCVGARNAVPAGATSTGTFRESWQVLWEPLFEVALAEASCWGGTVAAASTEKALAKAAESTTLGSLTVIVEPSFFALTTTPSIAPSSCELTRPVKAAAAELCA